MIYVVLGMHKSGTTLISQILHHSGVNMVDDLDEAVTYDEGNKYERQSILHLNMDILGVDNYEVIELAAPARPVANESQRHRMAEIVTGCTERYDDWGFKDPRSCLVYPLWANTLPEHKIIAVYREPSQIRKHFTSPRSLRKYRVPRMTWLYLNRWYEHNMNIVNYLQGSTREFIVLSYNALMSGDREFDRLREFVGLDLEDRRRKDLYRGRKRETFLFKASDWLMKRTRGHNVREVTEILDRLRDRTLCHLDRSSA